MGSGPHSGANLHGTTVRRTIDIFSDVPTVSAHWTHIRMDEARGRNFCRHCKRLWRAYGQSALNAQTSTVYELWSFNSQNHLILQAQILIENRSTNSGQNVSFSKELLAERGINVKSVSDASHYRYMTTRNMPTSAPTCILGILLVGKTCPITVISSASKGYWPICGWNSNRGFSMRHYFFHRGGASNLLLFNWF